MVKFNIFKTLRYSPNLLVVLCSLYGRACACGETGRGGCEALEGCTKKLCSMNMYVVDNSVTPEYINGEVTSE